VGIRGPGGVRCAAPAAALSTPLLGFRAAAPWFCSINSRAFFQERSVAPASTCVFDPRESRLTGGVPRLLRVVVLRLPHLRASGRPCRSCHRRGSSPPPCPQRPATPPRLVRWPSWCGMQVSGCLEACAKTTVPLVGTGGLRRTASDRSLYSCQHGRRSMHARTATQWGAPVNGCTGPFACDDDPFKI
jgi:hypothetical protein